MPIVVFARPAATDDALDRLPLDIVLQRLAMADRATAQAIRVLAVAALRRATDAA